MLESIEPGDVFGDLSFLTGRSYPSDASLKALEPSKIMEVSIDSFQRILRENSEFTVALLKSLGKKMVRVGRSDFVAPTKTGEDESKPCAHILPIQVSLKLFRLDFALLRSLTIQS